MVFSYNQEIKTTIATIQNGNANEQYKCSFRACANPVCTCGTLYLTFFPLENKDQDNPISTQIVMLNIIRRGLDYKVESEIPEETLEFANLLLSSMDDADFQFLWEDYSTIKNKMTAKAANDSIEAHFDYHEIEENGLMVTYNDILPYGDHLFVKLNGEKYWIYDQYCVLPKCACSEASLAFCKVGEFNEPMTEPVEEQYSVTLDYRNRKWGMLKGDTNSADIKTVRAAVEEQIPDICEKLLNRHTKLKSIYSHCKKRHLKQKQQHHPPEAGRNDPCPCGSGKKYKKCCLGKSST